MITESTIYWITRLDSLVGLLVAFVVIFAICLGGGLIIWFVATVENHTHETAFEDLPAIKRWIKSFAVLELVTSLVLVMTPTTKEMAMIKVLPIIANSKFTQETLPAELKDIYTLCKKGLHESLKEKAKASTE